MADNAWSQSGCRPDVWIYGVPNQGAYAWTARFGMYWVTGGVYQAWKSQGFECGLAGPPVKESGWIAEMNYGRGCVGQWFENAAIGFHDGAWHIMYGQYGQTAGRLAGFVDKIRRRRRRSEKILLRGFAPPLGDHRAPPVPPLPSAIIG